MPQIAFSAEVKLFKSRAVVKLLFESCTAARVLSNVISGHRVCSQELNLANNETTYEYELFLSFKIFGNTFAAVENFGCRPATKERNDADI